MSRFNPLNWFRRNPKAGDRERFARRAIDSGDEVMETTSIRWPYELKILAMRRARVMGLSLGEYVRYLVARDIDSDTVPGQPCDWHGPYDNQFSGASVSVVILVAERTA